MENKCVVVVSIDSEVWSTWSLNFRPNKSQQIEIKKMVMQTLKGVSDPDRSGHVDFIDNVVSTDFVELITGIKELIKSEFEEDLS